MDPTPTIAALYHLETQIVNVSRTPVPVPAGAFGDDERNPGLGSKFGHLDSGSTLHVPVKKYPEATESICFIDTRGTYRFARNDDRRDDSP